MKLVFIEELPEKRRPKHSLQNVIDEFIDSGNEVAMIDFSDHDYKSPRVCYSCMWVAAKNSKHRVKAKMRDGGVYLVRI